MLKKNGKRFKKVYLLNSRFFMMSMLFNKKSPEDFGLMPAEDPETFILLSDNSLWKQRALYDFGWGKENGFYRLPLPGFNDLVNIILDSESDDDKYGAASVILDDYPDELLIRCQEILNDKEKANLYSEFFKILKLDMPINRSSILGKNINEVNEDYIKWKDVSNKIKQILKI